MASVRPSDMSESIRISDYDPSWPRQFEAEADRVRRVIGEVCIEHHGSTAIPGMPAKPVIDMMVAIDTISQGDRYARSLENDVYEPVDPRYREKMPERIVLIRRGSDGSRRCHVHLLLRHHRMWRKQLAFRDYLRSHPKVASDYAVLKRRLAGELGRDRHRYMMAKTEFIEGVTSLALAEQGGSTDTLSRRR